VHGCIENGVPRRTDLTLLPDLLKARGYTTIMVGKTHFGPVPDSFDVQEVLRGEKSAESDDGYGRHLRAHGYRRATAHPNPVPEELFCEAYLVDRTIEAIERARRAGGPFFAFCSLLSPHGPLDPPGRWAHLFDGRPLPALNYVPGEVATHPLHQRRLLGHLGREHDLPGFPGGEPDQAWIDGRRRLYYGLAAYCDAQVGRLLRWLDDAGLREETLVVFTSDHGTLLYDHGFEDKHSYYDAAWRVPLLLRLPGVLPQGERRGFASWTDLTATLLAAAGADLPSVQGFDLLAPLAAGGESPRRCAVGTLYLSCALATRRWKLEYYLEERTGRLFDRQRDPLERTDLYPDPAHRELRDALVRALLSWRGALTDVEFLRRSAPLSGAGGPVATRLAGYRRALRGTDAEQRLADDLDRLDAL
jgi:arylsulfatase A-like enzyme